MFPRLLLLQSKSLRPLLTGEFVGRSSKTQREMRKQWILSGVANGPIQPKNQPQNEKADQRSGQRRIFKMVDHFGDFQNSSLLLKMTKFSNPSRWATSSSRKILREIHKNSHNLKIGFVYRKNALKRIRTCNLYLLVEMNHIGWSKARHHYSSTSPR